MRHTHVGRPRRLRCFCLAAALIFCGSSLALAAPGQAPLHPSTQAPLSTQGPVRDFMFGRPRGWVSLRGSWLMPAERGELFAFVSDQLTVDKGDFRSAAFTAETGFALTPRLDAAVGVETGRKSLSSEYRHFIDNKGLPISQTTNLTQTNITGSIRFALLERGRSISRYAFVPRTITPFVGAGGGLYFYRFRQAGDFVDFVTQKVFSDTFGSDGWSPSAHVAGGADIRLWRSMYLTTEGRYVWTHGDLGPDFVDFDGINLNGFRLSTGLSLFFR